jgi:hypothetical protein
MVNRLTTHTHAGIAEERAQHPALNDPDAHELLQARGEDLVARVKGRRADELFDVRAVHERQISQSQMEEAEKVGETIGE